MSSFIFCHIAISCLIFRDYLESAKYKFILHLLAAISLNSNQITDKILQVRYVLAITFLGTTQINLVNVMRRLTVFTKLKIELALSYSVV